MTRNCGRVTISNASDNDRATTPSNARDVVRVASRGSSARAMTMEAVFTSSVGGSFCCTAQVSHGAAWRALAYRSEPAARRWPRRYRRPDTGQTSIGPHRLWATSAWVLNPGVPKVDASIINSRTAPPEAVATKEAERSFTAAPSPNGRVTDGVRAVTRPACAWVDARPRVQTMTCNLPSHQEDPRSTTSVGFRRPSGMKVRRNRLPRFPRESPRPHDY